MFSALLPHLSRGAWAAAEALIAPMLMLIISPQLLSLLGHQGFGAWSLVLAFAGFSQLLSLGSPTVLLLRLPTLKGNLVDASRLLRTALLISGVTSTVVFVLGVAFQERAATLVFGKMGDVELVGGLLLLSCVVLALQQADDVLSGALRGLERFDQSAKIELLARPLWGVAVLSVAAVGRSAVYVAAAHILYLAAKCLVKCRVEEIRQLLLQRDALGLRDATGVWQQGRWLMLQGLGGVLFGTADKLTIGHAFGSVVLARYSLCIQVTQFAHNLQAAAMQVVSTWSAGYGLRHGSERRRLARICLGIGCVATLLPLTLAGLAEPLLRIWLGNTVAAENVGLLRVLMLASVPLALSIPTHFALLGLGRSREVAFLLLGGGAASLVFMLLIAHNNTAETVALGRMAYGIAGCMGFLLLFKKG